MELKGRSLSFKTKLLMLSRVCWLGESPSRAKMKGIFKGFKYISQIFVVKEHEMEIGYPTDVRHVAHIGWDSGSSINAPTWMNEFKTASDFSSTSLSNFGQSSRETSWASQDFDQTRGFQQQGNFADNFRRPEIPKPPKKKTKASSTRSSKSRSSSYTTAIEETENTLM